MSHLTTLYDQIYEHINIHIQNLCQRITNATDMQFMKLTLVEMFTKLFVSLLTTAATGYEIVRYFALYKFTDVITVS